MYDEWIKLQEVEFFDLEEAAQLYDNGKTNEIDLKKIIAKTISNFKDYMNKRSQMLRSTNITPYLAPPWSSSLENSTSWIGGCRPSSFIRLLYTLSGRDIESRPNYED